MASSSLQRFPLWLLLIAMVTQVTSRPPPRRLDSQVLQDLFGSEIRSILQNWPDLTEGSAQSHSPSLVDGRGLSGQVVQAEVRPFLNFLTRQRRLRGRSRKGSGRGCFGMKVDRIGALSGLGC